MTAYLTLDSVALAAPGGQRLFDGLTLACGRERIGVVGRNGSGKSSLLRLIAGVTERLERLRRLERGEGSLTDAADADWTLETRVQEALAASGLPAAALDRRLESFSGGERTRIAL